MGDSYELVEGVIGVPTYSIEQFRKRRSNVALVIPVINESPRITNQLNRIKLLDLDLDVVIADGGSTDGSLEFFRDSDRFLTALLIKISPGQLSTQLRMAFHYCIENNYEYVITMDGNDKDGVSGISTILKAISNRYDFIQGSRFIPGGHSENTPISRYLGIRLIHAPFSSFASRKKFTDTTNGFRAFSRSFLSSTEVSVFRDVFTSYELLAYLPIAAGKLGFSSIEVPVSRVYPLKGATPTKIVGIRAQLKLLLILTKAVLGIYDPKKIRKEKSVNEE